MMGLDWVNARSTLITPLCQSEICDFGKHLLECGLAIDISKIVMTKICCSAIYELAGHGFLSLALDKAFYDRLILERN